MNSRDFCFWLQGFFEITGTKKLTPEQVEMVKDHLKMVFNGVQKETVIPFQQKIGDWKPLDSITTVTC